MGGSIGTALAYGRIGSSLTGSVSNAPVSAREKRTAFGKFFVGAVTLIDRLRDTFKDPKKMAEERAGSTETEVSARHFIFER